MLDLPFGPGPEPEPEPHRWRKCHAIIVIFMIFQFRCLAWFWARDTNGVMVGISQFSGEWDRGCQAYLPHDVYFHGVCVMVKCLMVHTFYRGSDTWISI